MLGFAKAPVNFRKPNMTKITRKKASQPGPKQPGRPTSSHARKNGVLFNLSGTFHQMQRKVKVFLARRPHRSFRLTRRRDYVRTLRLPGYWSFTNEVRRLLWRHKGTFSLLAIFYALLSILLVGLGSQSAYDQLSSALHATSGQFFQGSFGAISQATLLLAASINTGLNTGVTDVQRVYAALIVILIWLTTVWLLRAILSGTKPRLRDGLYNAGAPLVPAFLISLVLVLQLLPAALAVIGVTTAVSAGLYDSGPLSMLISLFALLLTVLSLYWTTSTFMALIVVTLPGMYPLQALRTAGDLVIGRRIRIIFRLLWLLLTIAATALITMVPFILFDAWIKSVFSFMKAVPLVPTALLLLTSLVAVWSASYIYLLYRKVVDDDAAPA